MGSNWSGVCHRPLELPPHVADMEGTVTQLTLSIILSRNNSTLSPACPLQYTVWHTLNVLFNGCMLLLSPLQVCPALAMGNTVVLKPATYTRLSALLFAEICAEAGLPPDQLAGRVCVRVVQPMSTFAPACVMSRLYGASSLPTSLAGGSETTSRHRWLWQEDLSGAIVAGVSGTHNGSFLPEVARTRRDAIEERITSIYSPPFYTGRYSHTLGHVHTHTLTHIPSLSLQQWLHEATSEPT